MDGSIAFHSRIRNRLNDIIRNNMDSDYTQDLMDIRDSFNDHIKEIQKVKEDMNQR